MKLMTRAPRGLPWIPVRPARGVVIGCIFGCLALSAVARAGVRTALAEQIADDSAAMPPAHDKAYWQAIKAANYAVPKGESPAALILELTDILGSTDPELRDGFGYEIPADWVYRQKLLAPDELRTWMRKLEANLQVKIGERDTDSVLLRSFSALDLSLIAAADLQEPFLEPAEFESLLRSALAYLAAEKDVRGFVPGKGWHHSVAHTADLLKFLARDPQLEKAEQARILNAIADKLFAPETGVLTHGEDERLAAAVLSIIRRPDFQTEVFDAWVDRFVAEAEPLWRTQPLDLDRFHAVQNGKNLLKSLYLDLDLVSGQTTGVSHARSKLRAALAAM